MILDYGPQVRCALSINHNHSFGRKFQACEFRICGTKGAAYVKLGVNLDYPKGEPDELWLNTGMLVCASIAMQWSRLQAGAHKLPETRLGLGFATLFTLGFLGGQLWLDVDANDVHQHALLDLGCSGDSSPRLLHIDRNFQRGGMFVLA